jgi:GH18 family chitinase
VNQHKHKHFRRKWKQKKAISSFSKFEITFVVVFLTFTVAIFSATAQIKNPWVGAYYMSYSHIRPANIDWNGITHVYHLGEGVKTGFVTSGPSYWQLTNSPADSSLFFTNDGNFQGINIVKELISTVHAKGGKVILSTGTPFGSNRKAFLIDTAILQTAVITIVNFAKRWGYDGIDVDWESLDKTNTFISQLTRMLRTSLDRWNPAGILTLSFGHQDVEYYNPEIQNIVQQFNVFGYDLKQNNDNVTSFNSPLYAPPVSLSSSLNDWQDNWFGTWGKYPGVVQNGVRKMMKNGFDSEKLCI